MSIVQAPPQIPENQEYRDKIMRFQERLSAMPDALGPEDLPLKHSFGEGCYIREMLHPKGVLTVTKIHKFAHPFFLMSGRMSMMTQEGFRSIEAPFYTVTPAGTKRVIYAHEDCIVVTVHATNETDLDKIEDQIIAKTFEDLPSIPGETQKMIAEAKAQGE